MIEFFLGFLAGVAIVVLIMSIAVYRAARIINESKKSGRTQTLANQFSLARNATKRNRRGTSAITDTP